MKGYRVRSARNRGAISSVSDLSVRLEQPGDFVIVMRDVPRTFIMLCPDGCGERVVLNLDERMGAAWRAYNRKGKTSLFPSVWRDTGCKSHFVLWNNVICWFDRYDIERASELGSGLENRVYSRLPFSKFVHFCELADALEEIPWDVLRVCKNLCSRSLATEGMGSAQGMFKKEWTSQQLGSD